MHDTDSSRVSLVLGVDTPQRTFSFMSYMLKTRTDYDEKTRIRVRRIMSEAKIDIVGNTHDHLFMYHKKKQQ